MRCKSGDIHSAFREGEKKGTLQNQKEGIQEKVEKFRP